ncbi:MAG: substrate-binding domain-containing protein [Nitrospinae bacterium]|nr:substrate-binding domain-containing protein [Nitrospinota bacterium]
MSMPLFRFVGGMLATAVLVFASAALAAEKIVIAGDPCTAPVARKLGEAFTAKSGVVVEVTQGACRSGVSGVLGKKADIGVSTFNFGEGQLDASLSKTVVGKAPIVFVVNKANPVASITKEQAARIMNGSIRNWKELGGKDAPIDNVYLQPCVLETMTFETDSAGKTEGLRTIAPATKGNPMTGTNTIVAENEGAIGLQLYGYESGDVKVLKIDGVLPSPKTVPGAYTYYEDFNIITNSATSAPVKAFVEFARSDEGRGILLSWKHVPEDRG